MSVYALIEQFGVLQIAVALIMNEMANFDFTSEIQNHCPETGQCRPNVYS